MTIKDSIAGDGDITNEFNYNYNYNHLETITSGKQWKNQHSSHHHVRKPPLDASCFEMIQKQKSFI